MTEPLTPGTPLPLLGEPDRDRNDVADQLLLLKRAGGSVTVCHHSPSTPIGEHTAPYDVLLHVLKGSATLTIDGRPVPVSCGEACVIPAGSQRAVEPQDDFSFLLVLLKEQAR